MIQYTVQKRIPTTGADKTPKYYPVRAAASPVALDEMCRAIAEKTTLTRADVHGTLCAIEEQIVNHVKEGHIVKFGLLGTFRPAVNSATVLASDEEQVKYMNKVPSNFVKRLRLRFYPSAELLSRVNVEAEYEKVEAMPQKKPTVKG